MVFASSRPRPILASSARTAAGAATRTSGPTEQRPAAAPPALSVQGHTRHAQRVEVPADGALGGLEQLGEPSGGQLPVHLEEEHDGDEAVRPHRTMVRNK